MPPSITKSLPVIHEARSDTRNATSSAISAGSPGRPSGIPCPAEVPGHSGDAHPPGRYPHGEQHAQALEEDRVHVAVRGAGDDHDRGAKAPAGTGKHGRLRPVTTVLTRDCRHS